MDRTVQAAEAWRGHRPPNPGSSVCPLLAPLAAPRILLEDPGPGGIMPPGPDPKISFWEPGPAPRGGRAA